MPGLRISGGRWRGRRLAAVVGTRPTQEQVREALFSRWQPRLPGAQLLELFSGSGVVGLEAMSRGVRSVTFVDAHRRAVEVLRENCRQFEVASPDIVRARLPQLLERLSGEYDLIFADPPYDSDLYESLLKLAAPRLRRQGELTVEHSKRVILPKKAGGLVAVGTRRYGETGLIFYRHPEAVDD